LPRVWGRAMTEVEEELLAFAHFYNRLAEGARQ
jgi:hypothetical protein